MQNSKPDNAKLSTDKRTTQPWQRSARRSRRSHLFTSAALATILILTGCSNGAPPLNDLTSYELKLREAAGHLDAVAADLDRFGTISVSTPGVAFGLGEHAAESLKMDPKALLISPTTQGFSSINSQQELQIRVSLAAKLAEAGLVDAAKKVLTTPTDGTDGGDGAEDEDQVVAPELPEGDASRIAKAFTDRLTVPSPDNLGLSRRQRILLAKDDQMTLAAVNLAGSPQAELFGENKLLYAALVSVSLRPGRDTYKDHVAEVELSVEYAYRKKGSTGLPDRWPNRNPVVFAAFPALDSQVLDLRRTDRRLFALAAKLEAAVPEAAGKIQTEFRRLFEADRATLEARNTVVAFNSGGRNFGWRFTPRFTAQGDPAAENPEPSNRLFEQSFPALVFFLADKSDLCKRYGGEVDPGPSEAEISGTPGEIDGTNIKCANHFVVKNSTRWLRAPDQAGDESWLPFSGTVSRANQNRLTETQALDWALRLDRAYSVGLKAHQNERPKFTSGHAWRNFVSRYNALVGSSIGLDVFTEIPTRKSPKKPASFALTAVAPSRGWNDADTYIVVQGRGFLAAGGAKKPKDSSDSCAALAGTSSPCVVTFYVGGRKIAPENVALDGKTAVIRVPRDSMTGTKASVDVTAVNKHGGSATIANAIRFDLSRADAGKVSTKPDSKLLITWTGTGPSRRIATLEVYGTPLPAEILNAISGASEDGSNANVAVDINLQDAKN